MEAKQGKNNYPLRKVTQALLDKILRDIKAGAPNKYAAEANGVTDTQFYNLLRQGICDINHGILDTIHAKLVTSLRKIEMEEITGCRSKIKKEKKGHKGAEWTLEHVYWRAFSSNTPAIELAEQMERDRQEKENEVSSKGQESETEKEGR